MINYVIPPLDRRKLPDELAQLFRMMRITMLLLVVGCMHLSAKSLSQTITLRVNKLPIAKVFETIESQTGYQIVYSDRFVTSTNLVTITADRMPLEDFLTNILTPEHLTYQIKEKTVVIRRLAVSERKNQGVVQPIQQRILTGKVTDEHGHPLPGVTVSAKGTSLAVTTDDGGVYQITIPLNSNTIVFTMVGFETFEQNIASRDVINVSMKASVSDLDEVVVVGYGTQKKANLSGAVGFVKMSDVVDNRPITSVSAALMGNLPGLSGAGFSGEPGSGYDLKIRGFTSINGGSPLILVDNVPMDIDNLNPADIESVSILKDASSAAIYGARAAFGVILITTKKSSKNQKTKFDYSNKSTFSRPQELAERASPLQHVQYLHDNAGIVNSAYWSGHNVPIWLGLLQEYQANPSKYPDGYAVVDNLPYPLKQTDVMEDMMAKHGTLSVNDFSVNGGTEKTTYRLSAGSTHENGVLYSNKDSYKRYNVSAFLSTDVRPWLTAQVTTLYSNANKKDPYAPTFNGINVWTGASQLPSYFPVGEGMDINGTYYNYNSPRNIIEKTVPDHLREDRMTLFGTLIVKPFSGLTITGEYAYNKGDDANILFNRKIQDLADGLEYRIVTANVNNSVYTDTESRSDQKTLNLYASYTTSVGDNEFTLLGGFNQEQSAWRSLWSQRVQMINDNLPSIGQGVGQITSSDDFLDYSLRGVFYRFNYSYKEKYLFEANGRYDGSSKFPSDYRFGFFPSFSAAWKISDEDFMQNLNTIFPLVKLRGSWGSIGNQDIEPYLFLAGMSSRTANWVAADGQLPITLGTPALIRTNFTWEKAQTANIGLDLSAASRKLSASFDLYSRKTLNMLGPGMDYPNLIGAASPQQNAADLVTNGWEFAGTWRDKVGNVSYRLGVNISDAQAKITKYKNDTKILTSYYEGQRIGEIWGLVTDRLYRVDDFVEGSLRETGDGVLTGGTLKPGVAKVRGARPNVGDVLYKYPDENGDIWNGPNTADDPGSRRIIGNSTPRYLYGLTGEVSYKGFSLAIFLEGVGKGDLWLSNNLIFPHAQGYTATIYANQLDYWTPQNPNSDNYFGRSYILNGVNTGNNRQVQTRYLQNAAYLDIKSITVSYNVPKRILDKLTFDRATVFVNGENIWSFNHLPQGLHPGTQMRGGGAIYPVMRKLTLGLNVSF